LLDVYYAELSTLLVNWAYSTDGHSTVMSAQHGDMGTWEVGERQQYAKRKLMLSAAMHKHPVTWTDGM